MKYTLSMLLLLGAGQGVLLAAFLLSGGRPKNRGNGWLGFFIGIVTYIIGAPVLVRHFYKNLPHLAATTFPLTLLAGPVLLFYLKKFTGEEQFFSQKKWVHFVPALVCLFVLLPFFAQGGDWKIAFLEGSKKAGLPISIQALWGFCCLHVLGYTWFCRRVLNKYRLRLADFLAETGPFDLHWLRFLVTANAAVWGIYALFFIGHSAGVFKNPYGMADVVFGYALTVVNYGAAWKALTRPALFQSFFEGKSAPAFKAEPPLLSEKNEERPAKYSRSGLEAQQSEEAANRLRTLMEGARPWLDPELTLDRLAAELDLPAKHLSQVINERFGVNFFDFVNQYRVREVQRRLQNGDDRQLTLLALAYECGFGTKSTFNAAFKKWAGASPTGWKKKLGI